jgi:glucose/arabinose dehydrogenase
MIYRDIVLLVLLLFVTEQIAVSALPINKLILPDANYHTQVLTKILNARQISVTSDNSVLFIGTTTDKVYAVKLQKASTGIIMQEPGRAPIVVASQLNIPSGVAVDDTTGHLYIACNDKIIRVPNAVQSAQSGSVFATPHLVRSLNPNSNSIHNIRYIKLHNSRLYVSLGAPCDACTVSDPMGTIASFDYNTDIEREQDFRIEARGIRNSVGFAFHPKSNDLWFTDMGRDNVSEDRSHDELNVLPSDNPSNINYGFPFCYEKNYADPEYNPKGGCKNYVPAKYILDSHAAASGMTFYTGDMLPNMKNKILIAEHGNPELNSTNGYRIATVDPNDPNNSSYKVFIDGFFDSSAWGRPVDVHNLSDGSILISDDYSGAIYRVSYHTSQSYVSSTSRFSFSIDFLSIIIQVSYV